MKRIFQAFALDLPEVLGSVPRLSARGEYEIAQHIVACARKHGIPVVEQSALAHGLADLDVDEEIPVELFEAAAALLAELGRLR
jgi:flagellar biosynthesis protein